jgi:hypothetical protein
MEAEHRSIEFAGPTVHCTSNSYHSHEFLHTKSVRTKIFMRILLTGIALAYITRSYAFF